MSLNFAVYLSFAVVYSLAVFLYYAVCLVFFPFGLCLVLVLSASLPLVCLSVLLSVAGFGS